MSRFISFILCCLLPFCVQAQENVKPFGLWLSELRAEALSQGISPEAFDEAFAGATPIQRVIELDRKQPESVMRLQTYLKNTVNDARVAEGRRLMAENRELLRRISAEYGVQPQYIVALWGMETNFGQNTGGFNILRSLATLAYDGRRSAFFRDELLKALKVMQQEGRPAEEMKGSWAGAMGQCQFMPSSFLNFAVDYNHDGRHDIWDTEADIFASIANYLKSSGWQAGEGWGMPVTLTQPLSAEQADIKQEKSIAEWNRLGVRTASGKPLRDSGQPVSVIYADKDINESPYLITDNYKVILKWNRSRLFATAVGTLADRLAASE